MYIVAIFSSFWVAAPCNFLGFRGHPRRLWELFERPLSVNRTDILGSVLAKPVLIQEGVSAVLPICFLDRPTLKNSTGTGPDPLTQQFPPRFFWAVFEFILASVRFGAKWTFFGSQVVQNWPQGPENHPRPHKKCFC